MNILIVDDEPLARSRLRRLLEALPECADSQIEEAADTLAARAALQRRAVHLLLLDIHMPGGSGLDLAAELLRQRAHAAAPPLLVFVTAHDEHALAAFEHGAVDYLTKPVRRERLAQAVERARALLGGENPGAALEPALAVLDRGALVRVPLRDVLYFRADNKYTMVRTLTRHHLIETSLGDLEQRHGERFVRIHRSVLVARTAIASVEHAGADEGGDWSVRLLALPETLPVSRRQLPLLRALLREPPQT
jgi:two-component system response regulator AlgR